jgi:hypothetical protein
MTMRHYVAVALATALLGGVGYETAAIAAGDGGAAAPTSTSSQKAKTQPGRLAVGVEVLRFGTRGKTLVARGQVTAKLTDGSGHSTTAHQAVTLTAATGGRCRVLHLFLDQLNLRLLGLTAHLDRVTLDVTGNARGGVLGALFCKLARAKAASSRKARALTAAVRRQRGHALRFRAYLQPRTAHSAATKKCEVLDLVVGPLDLDLLGLIVNLNRVHLNVIAERGKGKLGDLFCSLADDSPPPSGTTSTGTTAAAP